MNILFYIEPLIERGEPYWKLNWLNNNTASIINTLDNNYNCKIITNEPIASKAEDLDNIDLITLSQKELLQPFENGYLEASITWFNNTYTSEQLNYYKHLIKNKLNDFYPNIIITFTPVPFLNELFVDSQVLHMEFSLFSRKPFSETYFLDPVGVYSKSFIANNYQKINNLEISQNDLQTLISLKNELKYIIDQANPLKHLIDKYRNNYKYLIYIPLQFSNYYSFDGLTNIKSQYDFCTYVLDNIDENIGVIINQHPNHKVISNDAIEYFKYKYKNFIYENDFNEIFASGQFIVPLVDCVITVSSTLAWHTLLHDKKLVCIGKGDYNYMADSRSLCKLNETLESPHKNKDKILYFLLFKFTIPHKYLTSKTWLKSFLNRLIHDPHKTFIEDNISDIESLSTDLIKSTILGYLSLGIANIFLAKIYKRYEIKVVCIGTSNAYHKFKTKIIDLYKIKIDYLCDNSNDRIGTIYDGMNVSSVESILKRKNEKFIVIITSSYFDEIYAQVSKYDNIYYIFDYLKIVKTCKIK